jgi:hypothetical protein
VGSTHNWLRYSDFNPDIKSNSYGGIVINEGVSGGVYLELQMGASIPILDK